MAGALALLVALLLWPRARPALAGHCPHGELRRGWGDVPKCCPKCDWGPGDDSPCEAAQDPDCKCREGSACTDRPCLYCQSLPRCDPGMEPARIGQEDFRFKCKPCENGTYSSGRSGWCHNWTDCESRGFLTLRQGNSTHNSVCGFPVPAPQPAGIALEFPSSTVLAILTAAALFVLLLLTLLLHFCIWSLRREKKFPPGDLGPAFPRLPALPLPLQGEESRSIQFPEEEHGDKAAEEKLSVLSLKLYSELR